jgi:hypothetical protein
MTDERLVQFDRIRRADAFSTAITVLKDAAAQGDFKDGPELWRDSEEVVIPLLEAKMGKGSVSV